MKCRRTDIVGLIDLWGPFYVSCLDCGWRAVFIGGNAPTPTSYFYGCNGCMKLISVNDHTTFNYPLIEDSTFHQILKDKINGINN